MGTSIVDICNNALQGLKANRILALDDGSEEAALCNQAWPSVRDAVLASHPWNCSMKLAQLQQSSTAPAWKWAYAYPLPSDCLRVFSVAGASEADVANWEVQSGEILCDEDAPLYIAYGRRETDPTKYDPLLTKALEAALAAEIAYPLTVSVTARQAAETLYLNRLREARGVDARQGTTVEPVTTSTWQYAKLGGRYLR